MAHTSMLHVRVDDKLKAEATKFRLRPNYV